MFRMLQEGGWPAMLALFVGVVALLVAVAGVAAIGFARRTAFVIGLVALGLASIAALVGALGVAWGHMQVERALGMIENAAVVERILGVGYREAGNCGTIGCAVAILPIVLGAIAALVGSRAPGSGMGRTFVALGLVGFAVVTALAALATSFSRPPPGKYALDLEDETGWHVADARATIDIPGKRDEGCDALDDALKDLRISRAGEVPTRFARDLDGVVPGTRAEAARCAREVFERIKLAGGSAVRMSSASMYGRGPSTWTRDTLLDAPILVDDGLRKEIAAWSPEPRKRSLR
jgi:hypothetical protein